jgi:uroporphyrinogen-III synthase
MSLEMTRVSAGKGKRIPLDEIEPVVAETIDEAYQDCLVNDGLRLQIEFASKEAAEEFLREARSYAYQHDPRYIVTGNPTAKGMARFRVELYEAPAEDAAVA